MTTEVNWPASAADTRRSGRVEIESKEDAKSVGHQSPDRAEALMLAFAHVVPRQQTVAFSQRVSISLV
jgi:hypothetical protein